MMEKNWSRLCCKSPVTQRLIMVKNTESLPWLRDWLWSNCQSLQTQSPQTQSLQTYSKNDYGHIWEDSTDSKSTDSKKSTGISETDYGQIHKVSHDSEIDYGQIAKVSHDSENDYGQKCESLQTHVPQTQSLQEYQRLIMVKFWKSTVKRSR